MKVDNSAIIFEGQSEFDLHPIVAIATGFNGTDNEKLGQNVVQIWVLRSDVNPVEAVKSKKDRAICGSCPLKGTICYIVPFQAPRSIYEAYSAGRYKPLSETQLNKMRLYQKVLRLTAYGDLGAIGFAPVQPLVDAAKSTLGYTHAWRLRPQFKGRLMASVSTVKAALTAQAKGWKTYRAKKQSDPLLPGEILCPNQINPAEQCEDCQICNGKITNVAINVHGSKHKIKNFIEKF